MTDTQWKAVDREAQQQLVNARMSKVLHKVAVISGKGGVGKSTVTVNLAAASAQKGLSVGILDADIHGPSIPKMLGLRGSQIRAGPPGVFPAIGPLGIKAVSMDFFLPSDETPVVWRGPLKMTVIRQFLSEVVWGNLDYLYVDLPPGTGDEPLSVMQLVPEMDGTVIVTIPSEVSQVVVKKAVTFSRQMKVPVIGVIENMNGFVCPNCGHETKIFKTGGGELIANDLNVPFLGSIPLDPSVCTASDKGVPFIVEQSSSPAARAFVKIAEAIDEALKNRSQKAEGGAAG